MQASSPCNPHKLYAKFASQKLTPKSKIHLVLILFPPSP